MHSVLQKKALGSLVAGSLLLGGVGLAAAGVLPVPFDTITTSHEGESPEGHGPPADVDASGEDDEVEAQNGEDGPDENADQTAKDVHEARRLAEALGEDAPPCATGVYVSSAATGEWDPFADPEGAPTEEDMPCTEGGVGAEIEGEKGGPPAHAGTRGDVDGDGTPGRSGGDEG